MHCTLALVGNPNVGKTAVFNALTGLAHNTGNYPGVTVDRKYGKADLDGISIVLVDLPGSYSLAARSPDEILVSDVLLDQQRGEAAIDGLVAVVDASNIERNLYFISQLLELGKPMVIALNMMDIAKRRKLDIDANALSERLGAPVIPMCARNGEGIGALRTAMRKLASGGLSAPIPGYLPSAAHQEAVALLKSELDGYAEILGRTVPEFEISRLLVDKNGYAEKRLCRHLGESFSSSLAEHRANLTLNGVSLAALEARARYAWISDIMNGTVVRPDIRTRHRSESIDNILTHRVFGTLVFAALMLLVFQSIFAGAAPIMDLVDGGVGALGTWAGALLPEGMLRSLVVDGLIAGAGGVLIFLPQILLLSFFIALLEDVGYMSRAAFLLDRLLGWCGLSGQYFIPMLSSFACAIPGIMATRTIHNRHDRLTTILVAPLMSCSARLPVYIIMISAFVPDRKVAGVFDLHGLTLFGMYMLGIVVAVPVAWIIKRFFFRGEKPPFLLEMPSYKVPKASAVLQKVYSDGREFVVRAGTLICAVAVLVWAMAYFPHDPGITVKYDAERQAATTIGLGEEDVTARLAEIDHLESGEYLRTSVLGRAGRFIEPAFRPLGWDWRIATAVVASFPAREIIIATLGTLFNMGAGTDEMDEGLIDRLRTVTREDGSLLFTLPVALSIMVFFALCCQCAATLVTIRRETKQWRWPVITFTYMTVLAYAAALITFQGATALGWGG